MNLTEIMITVLVLGMIFSGILLLKQSAKKFNLTDKQKKSIQEREKKQQDKDSQQ